MGPIVRIITVVVVFCISSAVALEAQAENQGSYANETKTKIVVEIDYGPKAVSEPPDELPGGHVPVEPARLPGC